MFDAQDIMATQDRISESALSSVRQVAAMISEAQVRTEERAKATHERFNVFTTLLQAHDEVRLHSRFLHCLLDPKGTHDCGSLFLELFFITLAEPLGMLNSTTLGNAVCPVPDEKWRVLKETGRSEGYGQMDLLLDHPQGFGIAIENKIYAYEQNGQLASYAQYLRQKYNTDWVLIYLTLDGKESVTHGKNPYIRISYGEHILAWLDQCLEKTYQIIPVNQVLLQYRSLVRKLTGKTMETETLKKIASYVANNPEIVRYREQISDAVDEAQTALLEELSKQVILRLKNEFEIRMEPANGRFGSGKYEVLIIEGREGKALVEEPFKLCLEYDGEFGELAIGVFVSYDTKKQLLSDAQQLFADRMKAANPLFDPAENKPTKAWPLGWVSLLVGLDDDGLADLMQKGVPAILGELCDGIRDYVREFLLTSQKIKSNQ